MRNDELTGFDPQVDAVNRDKAAERIAQRFTVKKTGRRETFPGPVPNPSFANHEM
jgi:hypothetical protein